MRPSDLSKADPVVFVIGDITTHFDRVDTAILEEAEHQLKEQFRAAKKEIKDVQNKVGLKEHGYILYIGEVYKAFYNNDKVEKIKGEEAKSIKRKIKSALVTTVASPA